MNARRVKTEILYNGRDISAFVIDFNYTDNTDSTDDVSIKISDREAKWSNEWFPETGDLLTCNIKVFDWEFESDNRVIKLGDFEVDNVEFSDTVTINGIAIPITSNIRSEKKNKTWKKISLKNIVLDISSKSKLKLVYETSVNPFYDNQDQNDKSDMEFIEELCKSDGLCLKVTDSQLIVFDESKYDTLETVINIKKGSSHIIGIPKFKRNAKNIYTSCEISYFDSKTDKIYKGFFKPENVGNVGHVLKLRENFNSEKDDMNLNRKAKARLREQNKKEWTCDLSLKGDIIFFAGTNITFEGFYKFDGKYNITNCTHSISSSGYTVGVSTRKCLVGY